LLVPVSGSGWQRPEFLAEFGFRRNSAGIPPEFRRNSAGIPLELPFPVQEFRPSKTGTGTGNRNSGDILVARMRVTVRTTTKVIIYLLTNYYCSS
jgi:hypothetical protein